MTFKTQRRKLFDRVYTYTPKGRLHLIFQAEISPKSEPMTTFNNNRPMKRMPK